MSAITLLQASLENCQIVHNSLINRTADTDLMAATLDCIEKLEAILDRLGSQEDWDAEGFQAFLAQFKRQQRVRRELGVLTHLQTPLLASGKDDRAEIASPAIVLS